MCLDIPSQAAFLTINYAHSFGRKEQGLCNMLHRPEVKISARDHIHVGTEIHTSLTCMAS